MKKKVVVTLMTAVLTAGLASGYVLAEETADTAAVAETSVEEVSLDVGEMYVYDYGDYKLHVYQTNDAITDICYILETDTNLIGIESPCFYDNLEEYMTYIDELGKPMDDLLLPYHPCGGETLQVENTYATEKTLELLEEGGSNRSMIDGFIEAFGDAFDGTVHEITNVIEPGNITIGGVDLVITEASDGFNIEIPAINCVYIHMMGSDVHNILTSNEVIDELTAQLEDYKDRGFSLVLTSHYLPEGMDAVDQKLAYLAETKEIAAESADSEAFIAAMQEAFPNYSGESFLEMSAAALVPGQAE